MVADRKECSSYRSASSSSSEALLWASRYLTIMGQAMLNPCFAAQSPLIGRVPGMTTAYSGMAAPLSSTFSFTQSYTGMDFDSVTPGAITAPFLTNMPSTITEPAPTKQSSSTTTGLSPTGSSTPPNWTPVDKCTFLPTCAQDPTKAWLSIIDPSST